jgi:hypothetical protein
VAEPAGRPGAGGDRGAPRSVGLREVLGVAAVAVVVVLGASFLTGALPEDLQRVIFDSPIVVAIVIAGTAWILWGIATGRRSGS